MTGQRPGRRGPRPRVFKKLYGAVRDTPVIFAMAVLDTPSSRKRRMSSSRPSSREARHRGAWAGERHRAWPAPLGAHPPPVERSHRPAASRDSRRAPQARRRQSQRGTLNWIRAGPRSRILGDMVETVTAIAAVIGAVGSVTAGIGVLIVNGKIDRLTGRVDALESTMQTVLTLIAGRPAAAPSQPSSD